MPESRKKDALSGQAKTHISLDYSDDEIHYLLGIIVTGIDTIQTTRNVHPSKFGMGTLKKFFDNIPKDIRDHYKIDEWCCETDKMNDNGKSGFGVSDPGYSVDSESISKAEKKVQEPYG